MVDGTAHGRSGPDIRGRLARPAGHGQFRGRIPRAVRLVAGEYGYDSDSRDRPHRCNGICRLDDAYDLFQRCEE